MTLFLHRLGSGAVLFPADPSFCPQGIAGCVYAPLAAFDVIRVWMLLEMIAFTDTEKNMIKASTQNKLDYRSVSQALRAQWSDRSLQSRDHRPHSALWADGTD